MSNKNEEDIVVVEESFMTLAKPASAEFVGSIFFLFLAVGLAVSTTDFVAPGNIQIGIALAFGFCVFVIAFSIGHISGGHLNPAVTLAFVVVRKISVKRGLMYFGAQLLGGIIGVALVKLWTPPRFQGDDCLGSNVLGADVTQGMAFGMEFTLTFFLLLVVSAASDASKSNTTLVPFAIGSAVTCAHFVAISLTGTSINPTRSFASAFVSLGTSDCASRVWGPHWIFWLAPLMGGVAGALSYEFLFIQDFGLQNTLLAMYTNKNKPMPGYVDRFKRQRQQAPVRQSGADVELEDEI